MRRNSLISCWFGEQCHSCTYRQFVELDVFTPLFGRQKDKERKSRLSLFLTKSGSHENVSHNQKTNTASTKWGNIYKLHINAKLYLTSILHVLPKFPAPSMTHCTLIETNRVTRIQNISCSIVRQELTLTLIYLFIYFAASYQKQRCNGATPLKNCCSTQVRFNAQNVWRTFRRIAVQISSFCCQTICSIWIVHC